jgi:hypothetical protein
MQVPGGRDSDAAIDTNDAAFEIEKWSARVSADQSRVSSDHGGRDIVDPTDSYHGRPSLTTTTGMTGRNAPVADLHMYPGPPLRSMAIRPLPRSAGLRHQSRDRFLDVSARASVPSGNQTLAACPRLPNDMCGGQNVAILTDDHSTALANSR